MKKSAFTLAELLVTLGIVGVIAALTIPTLLTDTEAAKIGPKLGKAVAVFEQANVALLAEEAVDSIYDGWGNNTNDPTDYLKALSRHMKIVENKDRALKTKDGIKYQITSLNKPVYVVDDEEAPIPSQEYITDELIISWGESPVPGTSSFYFVLYNDGSLRPQGGTNSYGGNSNDNIGEVGHWTKGCPKAEDGLVTTPKLCAGHIFENNMKVLYK